MKDNALSLQQCMVENEELRTRLKEAHEAIRAIRSGSVNALIVGEDSFGKKIYSQRSAGESYRILIQEMNEGALTLTREGLILFANNSFVEMIKMPLEAVIGSSIYKFINPEDRESFETLLAHSAEEKSCTESTLRAEDGTRIPVYLSLNTSSADGFENYYFMVTTDLTLHKRNEAISASEKLHRLIMEQTSEAIAVCDEAGRVIRVNQKANALCSIHPVGRFFENAFPCFLPNGEKYLLAESMQTKYHQEVYLNCNGRRIDLLLNAGSLKDEEKQLLGSVITLTDITEIKKLTTNLAQKMLLETTLISVGDGVISCDNKSNVMFLNKVAESLTGWTQETAKGKHIEEVFNIVNEFTGEKNANIESTNNTILISKDGTKRHIEDSAAPIMQENGDIIGVVLVFRDISERKQKQEEIEFLSYHDQLTGLYNRRFYEEELKRLDTERNIPIALVMADVNGVKLTNDAFGHDVGDELLRKVARIFKRECREGDIIARIGGDEFVFLLPKTDAKNANQFIERINAFIEGEKTDNIILSVSIGCAVKEDKSKNMSEVFKEAEDDMYRRKLYESSSMRSNSIDLIINSLFEKSNRDMLHSTRVSKICEAIAIVMNFEKDRINQVRTAGLMHDIGKIGIEDNILNKGGKLNNDEWNAIMRHPEIGYRILSLVNEFSEIADFVLEHHERWDGKGYPKCINGEAISLQARIIAIADAYDAMTSERPYRKAYSEEEAATEIRRCSGTQFDPSIARVFVENVLGKEWN